MLGGFSPLPMPLQGSDRLAGVSAEQHARFCADLLAVIRTARLAVARITYSGTTPTLASWRVMWGEAFAAPTITGSAGLVRLLWLPGYLDDFESEGPVNITQAHATVVDASNTDHFAAPRIISPRNVAVHTFDNTGSQSTADCSVAVW